MAKAAERIIPILVDCDWGRKNKDVSGRYGVRGYPTVIFTDPKGEEVERLARRDPASVKKQIESLAKRYKMKSKKEEGALGPVQLPFGSSLEKALAKGREGGKPVLMYFGDASEEAVTTAHALADKGLAQTLGKFVPVQHKIEKDCKVCKKHKARKGSLILVFDPRAEDPFKKPLAFIQGKRSVKSLSSALAKAYKKYQKAAI